MLDKIHSQRLTILANHLESGEGLKVGRFNFAAYDNKTCANGPCGCAMGESAHLWPGDFPSASQFGEDYMEEGMEFFSLTPEEYRHLFVSEKQDPEVFGGKILWYNATRYQVAANIRAFLEKKAQEN